MDKKVLIIIGVIVLIAGIGFKIYKFMSKTNAPKKVMEPKEQVEIDDDNGQNINTNGKKILVTYFSVPETDDPNKNMTTEEDNSAIVIDGKVLGNTQYVAMLISEKTGGDIYKIKPKVPYPTNHKDLIDLAKDEQNNNVRPELKNRISNFDDFDIIYVGYPIWWGDMSQILYAFFELYNLKIKQ